jgi:TRAP-type transport system small permease protein
VIFYRRLMQACGALAGAVIGVVVLLVCYDVIVRNLGFRSLPWIVEVTEYALPLSTFLAAPWLAWRNQHVRLDLLQNSLSPAGRRRVERAAAALALAVSLIIAWYAIAVIIDTRQIHSMVIKSLTFPEWWLFVPVPLSFGLLAFESLRRLFGPAQADDDLGISAHD